VIDSSTTFEELKEKEIYWIAHYDTYNNGYNSTIGGDGNQGYKPSEDTIKKLMLSMGKLRSIVVYDLEGNKIGEYELVAWAEKDLELARGPLHNILKGYSHVSKNYTSMYLDEYNHEAMLKKIDFIKNRTFNQVTSNTQLKDGLTLVFVPS
jgi:hypothetical protein